ncbi:Peptidase C54 [Kalmanozyma brasiliensis GHG001]|uniref:Peptidase C54 n=1 Tax=Kalmanozyma brasiliensis (strain GHG001) TaxID=1365824 RepID=UPI002867D283|nr:Peptidase C54 [Kalmanozyma brasiliensis GHG001]EST08519.2 Peptidase C54 [Kalmanozyma brasiliensis GHG001]
MTEASNRVDPRGEGKIGLPMRRIAIPQSPTTPLPLPAPPSDPALKEVQPKKGVRVRVNSLSAAAMFKSSSASSASSATPSSQQPDSFKSKSRPRSATVTDAGTPPVFAQSTFAQVSSHTASNLSMPMHASRPPLGPTTSSSASVSRIFSFRSQSRKEPESSTSAGSGNGLNRRKFFGRSNSIRSLLGGSNASSAGSNPLSAGSSFVSDTISGASIPSSSEATPAPGLLRRMGSKSLLNVTQAKAGATSNASSDDLVSTASAESHTPKRFSDSLKGMGRRRGKTNSRETSNSRSSSEAHPAGLVQGEAPTGHGASSRKSIESVRSGLSVTSAEPHPRSSESSSSNQHGQSIPRAHEQQTSVPKRLTGWLYNMVGSDNMSASREGGAPLSPVREAENLDFGHASPTPVRQDPGGNNDDDAQSMSPQPNAPFSLKAGAILQSLTPAGSNKAIKMTSASSGGNPPSTSVSSSGGGNAGSGGSSRTSVNNAGSGGGGNNASWVPAGVGFDRAFKFFMDSDASSKEDEGCWLLGVYHGPRQVGRGVATEVSAPQAPATATALIAQEAGGDEKSMEARASSPSSLVSTSSPRPSPLDLIRSSRISSSPAFDRASSPSIREESRVGSSISTAATESTSDSLRTKSSATSFNVVPRTPSSLHADSNSAFQRDFASRIWCTYRNSFAPISRDGTISDQAASAAEVSATALLEASHDVAVPSTPSGQSSFTEAGRWSSPPTSAGRGWLGRKVTESSAGQEAAMQMAGLGAALGTGYANASSTLGEKMGITNLWSRATAAAQAAGFSRAGLTTDSGWGCMLRTGQSLLANALVNVHLDRSWLREAPPMRQVDYLQELAGASLEPSAEKQNLSEWREERARHSTYIRILSWFLDDPSPACPFGVHRMAREGKRLGKEVGEWFGPSTAAGAIKQLASEFPSAGIAVELAHDGVFYLDEVRVAAGAKAPIKASQHFGKARASSSDGPGIKADGVTWQRPVLILIGIRLGLDSVNPIYYESVKATFSFPHSVGIAGGRPSSSYYFTGHQGNSLFYLDPHNVRPAVPLRYPPSEFPPAVSRQHDMAHRFVLEDRDDEDEWWSHAYSEAQTSTFHCEKVRRMPIKSLDPSMLLGFLVKDEADLADLCARIKALPKTIFSFAESAPKWVDDDDFDPSMESFSESSVGGESDDDDADERKDREAVERDLRATGSQNEQKQSSALFADGKSVSVSSVNLSDAALRESQQRTAEWLGKGRAMPSTSRRPDAPANPGIAFPSLDLLSLQQEGQALQRPSRLDARQVSTSSAATTRPVRRGKDDASPADRTKGRDLTASQNFAAPRPQRISPSRSPNEAGADESFSTVHLSDTEIGSAWEEVSDGGTIAPSSSARRGVLRSASPPRAIDTRLSSTAAGGDPGAVPSHATEAVEENPLSPISIVSDGDLVSLSLDTPVNETPLSTTRPAEEGSYFGLTAAHTPLSLPRRRSQSRSPPSVPPVPAASRAEATQSRQTDLNLDTSHDDF